MTKLYFFEGLRCAVWGVQRRYRYIWQHEMLGEDSTYYCNFMAQITAAFMSFVGVAP